MVCETYFKGTSTVHRLAPEVRIVACAGIAAVTAVGSEPRTAAAALLVGIFLAAAAHLPIRALLRRMAALNVFMAILLAVFALTGTEEMAMFGPVALSLEGMIRGLHIAVKANAIVLVLTALLSTMDVVTLGHALQNLKAPRKLTHLMFFTVRYIELLHHEYSRLRRAMKARCFRAGMNRHTYAAFGNAVGMLLVRSYDRSERVMAAMKCRGFRGDFPLMYEYKGGRTDAWFGVIFFLVFSTLAGLEWLI